MALLARDAIRRIRHLLLQFFFAIKPLLWERPWRVIDPHNSHRRSWIDRNYPCECTGVLWIKSVRWSFSSRGTWLLIGIVPTGIELVAFWFRCWNECDRCRFALAIDLMIDGGIPWTVPWRLRRSRRCMPSFQFELSVHGASRAICRVNQVSCNKTPSRRSWWLSAIARGNPAQSPDWTST